MAQAPTPRFSSEQKQPVVIQNKMPKAEPGDMTGQFGGGSGAGNTFRLVGNTGNQAGTQPTGNPYPVGYSSGVPYGLDTQSGPGASYQPSSGTTPPTTGGKEDPTTAQTTTRNTTTWGGKYVTPVDNPGPYNPLDIGRGIGWGYGYDPNTPSPGTTTNGYPGWNPSPRGDTSPGGGGFGPRSEPPKATQPGGMDSTRIFNTGGGASPGGGSNHHPQSPTTGGGGAGGWLTVGNPSGMTQQNRPGPGAPPPRDGVPGPRYGTSPDWPNRGWRSGVSGYQGPGPNVSPGSAPPPGGENAMYGRTMAPSSPGGGPGYLGPPAQENSFRSRPNGNTQLNPAYTQGYQPLSTANFWWLTPNPNDGPSNYEDPRYTGPRVPWNPSFTPGSRAGERLGPPGSGFVPPPGLPVDPGPGGNQDPRDRMMSPSLPPFPQFDPASPPNPQQLAQIMQQWYQQFVAATGGGGQGAPVSPQNPIQNPTWGAPWPGWQGGDDLRSQRPPIKR